MPARRVADEANRITVTLDIKDRQELDHLAGKQKRSRAYLVREAIQEYLARQRAAGVGRS
jgi:predicted transcriptional regulator